MKIAKGTRRVRGVGGRPLRSISDGSTVEGNGQVTLLLA